MVYLGVLDRLVRPVQKRLNRSKCRFGYALGMGVQITTGEGELLGMTSGFPCTVLRSAESPAADAVGRVIGPIPWSPLSRVVVVVVVDIDAQAARDSTASDIW